MPRTSPVPAPPVSPDFRLRFEVVHQPDVPNKQEILASTIGAVIFETAMNGMYMRHNGPLRAQRIARPGDRPITEYPHDLTTVVCALGSTQRTPQAQEWVFRRKAAVRRADPWKFADACTRRIAGLLDSTPHMRASDRDALYDRYTSGIREVSYLDLLGRVAYQMQQERVPQNERQLARAICIVGNTITTAITGRDITSVSFAPVPPGVLFEPNRPVAVV